MFFIKRFLHIKVLNETVSCMIIGMLLKFTVELSHSLCYKRKANHFPNRERCRNKKRSSVFLLVAISCIISPASYQMSVCTDLRGAIT